MGDLPGVLEILHPVSTIAGVVDAGFDVDDPYLTVKVDAIDGDGFHRELVYTGEDIPEQVMADLLAVDDQNNYNNSQG